MSDDLESKYPGAKITRAGEQSRPEGGSANRLADYEMESPGDYRRYDPDIVLAGHEPDTHARIWKSHARTRK